MKAHAGMMNEPASRFKWGGRSLFKPCSEFVTIASQRMRKDGFPIFAECSGIALSLECRAEERILSREAPALSSGEPPNTK
jgi:hypothetical protein